MKKLLAVLIALMFAAACGSLSVRAQDQAPDQGQPDSNSQSQPGVARISLINGDVSVQHAGSGDWVAATVNMPLEQGDRISTGAGSRAEVQLDYADVIRLDENSTAKIAALNNSQIQVQVGQGTVSYGVLEDGGPNAEMDTPNVAVHPLQKGEYRVEVPSDNQTVAIVRDGQADASVPQGSTEVNAGQEITVQGTSNPQYQTAAAPPMDDFDNWSRDRDAHIEDAQSWQHTDRYYTGTQDLDQYGHWEDVPDYGQVWVPAQGPDWAPYRDGEWQWEPYYGWTWVSFEPWGWAPYHYGRWFLYDDYWAWWPGPVGLYPGYYPIWAPAYVSFFGFGGGGFGFGFGFGFGYGDIGWLPLGPCDRFHRWYGRDARGFHVDRFGDSRHWRDGGDPPLFRGRGISNFDRVDSNARLRAGISSMRSNQFGRGRVSMRQASISASEFRGAGMVSGRMPFQHSAGSRGSIMRNVPPQIARTANANRQSFFSSRDAARTRLSGTPMQARNFTSHSAAGGSSRSGSRSFGAANNSANDNGRSIRSYTAPAMQSRGRTYATPPSVTSSRTGWHTFTPPARASNRQRSGPTSRFNGRGDAGALNSRGSFGRSGQQASPRSFQRSSPQTGQGGWRHFSPSSSRPQSSPRSSGSAGRPGWGSFSSRGYGSRQLDMRQPIARRPSYSYGNSRSYSAPNRSYSRPSYSRPSYSRPSYSRPSYSRPSYSRPSGGGGGYRGGGNRGGGGGSSRGGGSRGGGSRGGGHPHR